MTAYRDGCGQAPANVHSQQGKQCHVTALTEHINVSMKIYGLAMLYHTKQSTISGEAVLILTLLLDKIVITMLYIQISYCSTAYVSGNWNQTEKQSVNAEFKLWCLN